MLEGVFQSSCRLFGRDDDDITLWLGDLHPSATVRQVVENGLGHHRRETDPKPRLTSIAVTTAMSSAVAG